MRHEHWHDALLRMALPTAYLPDADAIVAHIAKNVQGGDVLVVFSNGGFGGIHGKLLDRLNRR